MEGSEAELEFGGITTILDIEQSVSGKESVFRAAVHSQEEADRWLEAYSKSSRSQWIVKDTFPNLTRLVYRKLYVCAFSSKNKHLQEGSKRNWNCASELDIKIKLITKETRKRDPLLKRDDPLQAIIRVSHIHSHNTETFTAWRCFRPGNDVRQKFMEYYADGCSPAAALQLHSIIIELLDDGLEEMGDSHYMPLKQTAYYWHRLFRQLNYGPPSKPFDTLKKKIELYKENGVTVVVREESPWAVAVVTPVMKRAHNLFWSKNIVFVDTSSSCDSTSTNVTLMLSATKAGAIPMAVLLHEGQSTECYAVAFELFKETFPNPFGGEKHPLTFMSDNSTAEKKALRLIWPDSLHLLCGFHVSQAEWDWIFTNMPKDKRQELMNAFQQIQYADSCESLENKIEELKEMSMDYYENRVKGLLDNKKEWVQLYRADLPIGGHHTNNYAEASIRVLKDVILQRTKAFNIVALVDYIGVSWEKYLQTRLTWFAYDRVSRPDILYQDLVKRMPADLAKEIECIEEGLYLVPSATNGGLEYEVRVKLGLCSCKAGAAGAFCKHRALLHQTHGGVFPNCPPITSADKYLLGVLAMGEACPPKSRFLGMRETLDDLETHLRELQVLYSFCLLPVDSSLIQHDQQTSQPSVDTPSFDHQPNDVENQETQRIQPSPAVNNEKNELIKSKFIANIHRIIELGSETNSEAFFKFMDRANNGMDAIENSNKAFEGMMKMSAALKSTSARSGKKIHVQPKAIARRKSKYRGNNRLPAGRHSNQAAGAQPVSLTQGSSVTPSGRPQDGIRKGQKRKRTLAASIQGAKRHIRKH